MRLPTQTSQRHASCMGVRVSSSVLSCTQARTPCISASLSSHQSCMCGAECLHTAAGTSLCAQERAHLWAATATPFVLVVTTVLDASPKEKVIGWPPTTIVESSVSVARKVKVWSVLAVVGSTVAARLVASSTATLHPQQSAERSDLFASTMHRQERPPYHVINALSMTHRSTGAPHLRRRKQYTVTLCRQYDAIKH